MDNFIYYISTNSIDQLYRKWIGPVSSEVQYSETNENGQEIGAKFGISKLLAVLSLSVNGSLKNKKVKSKQTKSEPHIEDRADRILHLINNKYITDVSLFNPNNVCDFYKFDLELEIIEKFIRNKQSTIIEVRAITDNIEIFGTTSYENWTTGSMLNTILYNAEDTKLSAYGILMPISFKQKEDRIYLLAQYLIIVKPGVSYE